MLPNRTARHWTFIIHPVTYDEEAQRRSYPTRLEPPALFTLMVKIRVDCYFIRLCRVETGCISRLELISRRMTSIQGRMESHECRSKGGKCLERNSRLFLWSLSLYISLARCVGVTLFLSRRKIPGTHIFESSFL